MMNSAQQPNLTAIASLFLLSSFACPVKAQFFPEHPTFFDEGNRQLEHEIQTLQESLPRNAVLTIDSDGLQWQKFVAPDGNFSALLPVGTLEAVSWEISTPTDVLNFTGAYIERPNYFFTVVASQPLQSLSAADTDVLLRAVYDDIVDDMGREATRETEISLANFPGQELIWVEDDATITIRFSQAGDRIYILGVGLENPNNLNSARQTFFDSFELP